MIINFPKVGDVSFPDDLSPAQFNSLVYRLAEKYDFPAPKPEASLGTIFKRGAMRGLGELGIAAGDTLPAMIGTAVGANEYAERQLAEAQTSREQLEEKYPTRFRSYKEVKGPGDALEFVAETGGELVPTAATAIIPGVGLGAVGSRVVGGAALRAATAGVAGREALAAPIVKAAAAQGAKRGMQAGVFLGSYAQTAPEIFENIYRETGQLEPSISALYGGLSAVLDSVLPAQTLSTLGGYGKAKIIAEMAKNSGAKPSVWKNLLKEVPKAAAVEGLTEGTQEVIGAYAEQVAGSAKELLSPENVQRYKEAFVKGAVGGGMFGVPTGISNYRTAYTDYSNTKEAEVALQAQYDQERAAGSLTPEKAAEYEDQLAASRAKRQADLEAAFKYMPDELAILQARMDAARPGSKAYAELDAEIAKLKEQQLKLDAEKSALSGFTTATPNEEGLFLPGAQPPAPPVVSNVAEQLGIVKRSKVGQFLNNIDISTPEGQRQLIQTVENPSFKGRINETAYNDLISTFDPQQVEAIRAELKGVPNVAGVDTTASGAGVGVATQPVTGAPTEGLEPPQRDGVVPIGQDVAQPAVGEEPSAPPVTGAPIEDTSTIADVASVPPTVLSKGRKAATGKTTAAPTTKKVEEPTLGASLEDIEKAKFTPDEAAVNTKLGKRKRGEMSSQEKDATAYFGRIPVRDALKWIADDLVRQPTAYRNSKMKAFEGDYKAPEGFPTGPEPFFAWEGEASMFQGQGGKHAKNAAEWARANLSPESVAFLDKNIAQYEKEELRARVSKERQNRQTKVKKATKVQIKEEGIKAEASEKAALKDMAEDVKEFGIKPNKNRKKAREYARAALEQYEGADADMDYIADNDLNTLLASPEVAQLYTTAHPAVIGMLERGNFVGAMRAFGGTASSERVAQIADVLSRLLGDVKLVYGAPESMYDPKTNTIYLRKDATDYEFLHEAAHAGLSHVIANPSHPVTKQLEQIFKQLQADVDGAYGAKSLQEFVAEVWSNDAFRTQLKEKYADVPNTSLWDKIVQAVRRMFGFPPKQGNALDMVDTLLNEIVSVPPGQRDGDTLYAQSIKHPNLTQRVFNATDNIIHKQKLVTPETAAQVLGAIEKSGLSLRTFAQRFLNLSALGQIGAKIVGQDSIKFADTVNEMAAYYGNLSKKLQPLKERLQEFSRSDRYGNWADLVNDSTLADVNPSLEPGEASKKYAGSAENLKAYKDLRARYAKLTPTEQQLYKDHFASFKVLFTEIKESIRKNLDETFVDENGNKDKEKALSAYNKIIDQITKMGIDHYSPLYREGEYWLQYTDKNTKQTVQRLFNTQAERRLAQTQVVADGHTGIEEYSRTENMTSKTVPRGTVAAQIVKIMRDGGADDAAVDKFLQLIVSALPETSLLKSFQTRKGTPGYEQDVSKAFSRVTDRTARQLSRMRYSEELQQLLDSMRKQANLKRGDESVRAKELVQEMEARFKFAINPQFSDIARYASTGSFYFNLAGNVSSAVVNTLQTPMVVLPQLGGEYGFIDSGRALLKAANIFKSSGFTRKIVDINGVEITQTGPVRVGLSVENLIGQGQHKQYKGLFTRLDELGLLVESMAHEALNPESLQGIAQKTARVSTAMFHQAERFNREVTAIAAYDLEMARLAKKGIKGEEAQTKAIEKAVRLVEFAHGAGHTESGPSIGQSDLGKILTVFKRFAFTMYYMLFDTMRRSKLLGLPPNADADQIAEAKVARRQLAGVYGMSALFAGAKGLPLYWVAEMAYNALNDDDEDDFDTVMRKYLGELAFKGPLNYFTNLGVADRVGWTDLIYRENKGDKADASALSQILENLLGAPWAVVNSVYRGKELIADGQFERGVEAMLPIALRNVLKGGRYMLEDARTLRGDEVGQVNGYNAAMQVLGFAPADLLAQYEINAYAKKMGDVITKQEKSLLKKYYIAQREGDYERADELRDKLFDLGDKYPELKISEKTITKSVKARDRISNDMYHGVQVNKKLRPLIERSIEELED